MTNHKFGVQHLETNKILVEVASTELGDVLDGDSNLFCLEVLYNLLESYLLQVQYNVGDIFLDSGHGGKLVLNTRDGNRVDGKTIERGEKDAAQSITNGSTETTFQGAEFELAELVVRLQHYYFIGFLKC